MTDTNRTAGPGWFRPACRAPLPRCAPSRDKSLPRRRRRAPAAFSFCNRRCWRSEAHCRRRRRRRQIVVVKSSSVVVLLIRFRHGWWLAPARPENEAVTEPLKAVTPVTKTRALPQVRLPPSLHHHRHHHHPPLHQSDDSSRNHNLAQDPQFMVRSRECRSFREAAGKHTTQPKPQLNNIHT